MPTGTSPLTSTSDTSRALRAALRVFLAQGTGGAVVAVGSVTGFMAAPEQGGYGAAKGRRAEPRPDGGGGVRRRSDPDERRRRGGDQHRGRRVRADARRD